MSPVLGGQSADEAGYAALAQGGQFGGPVSPWTTGMPATTTASPLWGPVAGQPINSGAWLTPGGPGSGQDLWSPWQNWAGSAGLGLTRAMSPTAQGGAATTPGGSLAAPAPPDNTVFPMGGYSFGPLPPGR